MHLTLLCTSTLSRFLAACTSITLCAPHSLCTSTWTAKSPDAPAWADAHGLGLTAWKPGIWMSPEPRCTGLGQRAEASRRGFAQGLGLAARKPWTPTAPVHGLASPEFAPSFCYFVFPRKWTLDFARKRVIRERSPRSGTGNDQSLDHTQGRVQCQRPNAHTRPNGSPQVESNHRECIAILTQKKAECSHKADTMPNAHTRPNAHTMPIFFGTTSSVHTHQ